MFGQNFYFSLIRKYVILVGTLVNDIIIIKTDKSGNQSGIIKVPVTYGPKDKMLARVLQDPNISRQTASPTLPLISFEMGQIKYDGTRKLNTVGKIAVKKDTNNFKYQYNPVPYNFEFKIYIYVKNTEDGTKIIEQILPYFTPDWTTTVNLIPEVEEIKDIPVILNGVNYEDTYDKDFKERRAIIWTLDLTLKGYLYGPVKSAGVIKFINTTFYIPNASDGKIQTVVGNTSPAEKLTLRPGLTANGTPTSNISLTIPYQEIEVSDDYGFIETITPNEDLI